MKNLETFDIITLCAKALVKDFTKTLANILAIVAMHVCMSRIIITQRCAMTSCSFLSKRENLKDRQVHAPPSPRNSQ